MTTEDSVEIPLGSARLYWILLRKGHGREWQVVRGEVFVAGATSDATVYIPSMPPDEHCIFAFGERENYVCLIFQKKENALAELARRRFALATESP